MKNNNFLKLSVSLASCLAAGYLGSIFTDPNIDTWYVLLNKPVFTPPNWLFAPVWTLLYIMMAVSLFMIWKSQDKNKRLAINVFVFQLIINFLWSVTFFAMKSPEFALLTIATLWLAIIATIMEFKRINQKASWLLWPYLLWVTYASALNLAIVRLN